MNTHKDCGTTLSTEQDCTCSESRQHANNKRKTKLIVGFCLCLAAVAIAITALLLSAKVDPAKFVSDPIFSGLNTLGSADVSFDKNGLIVEAIGDAPDDFFSTDYAEWFNEYVEYEDSIDISYDSGNLSNGDTFVVTIEVSEPADKRIKSVELVYTVDGLTEATTVDIFDGVDLVFSGISGRAEAELVLPDNELLNSCRFKIEPQTQLSNGDTVTVTLANEGTIMYKHHVIPKTISKQFTVSGLASYAKSKDIPVYRVNELVTAIIDAKTESHKNDASFTYSDVVLWGVYFLERTSSTRYGSVNELHIVISYDLYWRGEYLRTNYLPYIVKNIVVETNGTVAISVDDFSVPYFYTEIEKYYEDCNDGFVVTQIG